MICSTDFRNPNSLTDSRGNQGAENLRNLWIICLSSAEILALLGRQEGSGGRWRVCLSNAPASGSREPTTRRGGRVPPMYCAVRGGSSSPTCPPWRKLDTNQSPKAQH